MPTYNHTDTEKYQGLWESISHHNAIYNSFKNSFLPEGVQGVPAPSLAPEAPKYHPVHRAPKGHPVAPVPPMMPGGPGWHHGHGIHPMMHGGPEIHPLPGSFGPPPGPSCFPPPMSRYPVWPLGVSGHPGSPPAPPMGAAHPLHRAFDDHPMNGVHCPPPIAPLLPFAHGITPPITDVEVLGALALLGGALYLLL